MLAEKSDTAFPLELTIEQELVGGVTGKAPTVALRRGDSTTQYLDWDDGTFKTSGWGTKYSSMTEIERGHYARTLNLATTAGLAVGQTLVVEFHVDDGGDILGDDHDLLQIVEELYDVQSEA